MGTLTRTRARLLSLMQSITRREVVALAGAGAFALLLIVFTELALATTNHSLLRTIAWVGGVSALVLVASFIASRAVRRRRTGTTTSSPPQTLRPHVGDGVARDSRLAQQTRVTRAAGGVSSRALHVFGARADSSWTLDVIASQLSDERFTFEDLAALARASNAGSAAARQVLCSFAANRLYALGRLRTAQRRDAAIDARSLELFRHLADNSAPQLSVPNASGLAEHLVLAGDLARAERIVSLLPTDAPAVHLIRADLLNPFVAQARTPDPGVWLALVNDVFRPHGLDEVVLAIDGATPFDRLVAPTVDTAHGPLISVVMSSFRPDRTLITAVRSIVEQTWQDWELIVLDDASGPDFDEILDEAAALDPRVSVVRAEQNAGTYVRRNDGIARARGEFVTAHDSDDWAHPRRLEVQARHLMADPRLLANQSEAVRVTERIEFVQPRGARLRRSEASLLFRRKEVLDAVGYFDAVRKAADSEFRFRIEAATATKVTLLEIGAPLSLIRFDRSSLSAMEIGDGWMHPARIAYRSASEHWHSGFAIGRTDPRLSHPLVERRFPAPAHLLGRAAADDADEFDLLVVDDVRDGASSQRRLSAIAGEIAEAVDAGHRVAVLHLDSLCEERGLGIASAQLQELVNDGRVQRIDLTSSARASTVVVRRAAVLQGYPEQRANVQADRLVLVDEPTLDTAGESYVRADVESVAHSIFGAEPEWAIAVGGVDLMQFAPSRGA